MVSRIKNDNLNFQHGENPKLYRLKSLIHVPIHTLSRFCVSAFHSCWTEAKETSRKDVDNCWKSAKFI